MKRYFCYFSRLGGSVCDLSIVGAPDDEQAVRRACDIMLKTAAYESVEVVEDDRQVAVVTRDDAQAAAGGAE